MRTLETKDELTTQGCTSTAHSRATWTKVITSFSELNFGSHLLYNYQNLSLLGIIGNHAALPSASITTSTFLTIPYSG